MPYDRTAILAEICTRLSQGEPLAQICRDLHMPSVMQVWRWVNADKATALSIAQARAIGFDVIADDCLAIADDTSRDTMHTEQGERADTEWIARSKLRIETRLKLLAKWDPKRYGERSAVDVTNSDGSLAMDEATRSARAAQLLAAAAARKAADDGGDLA